MTDARGASAPAAPLLEACEGGLEGDDDIVQALQRGDRRNALALCVRRHALSIGRVCMAMLGSQTDADDVSQETLLTAHLCFADFRGEGSVRAWLLGIARNKCLRHLEKNRRRGAHLRLVPDAETVATAEELLGANKRAERARALLDRVRPSDRDALLLRYSADLTFKEVALVCGIAETAARKRVSRALLELRRVLEEENADD